MKDNYFYYYFNKYYTHLQSQLKQKPAQILWTLALGCQQEQLNYVSASTTLRTTRTLTRTPPDTTRERLSASKKYYSFYHLFLIAVVLRQHLA